MPSSAAPPADRQQLFDQTLDLLGRAFERELPSVLEAVATALERAGQAEPEQQLRRTLVAIAAMLRIEKRARVTAAVAALSGQVRICLESTRTAGDEARALLLIEEAELRAQILASEIAAPIRRNVSRYGAWPGRVRAIATGHWESDDLNPLGARTLAAAALVAFDRLADSGTSSAALDRAILSHLPEVLAAAIAGADRWLASMGVPSLAPPQAAPPATADTAQPAPTPDSDNPPEASAQTGTQPPSPVPDVDPERASELAVRAASTAASLGTSPLSDLHVPLPPRLLPTLQPVVEIERDAVAFAHSIDAVPYSRQARGGFFSNVRTRLRGAGAAPGQVAVVDVVAAMFDYVVDDQRIPEAAKPLIWRLQQPAVALALLDPAYLGDEPRSLRRLIENLGAIVNAFSDELPRGGELHRRLETVVRAVEIVAGALQTRSTVMARQVEHEYARAARNVTQLIERVVQERGSLESTPVRRNRRDYSSRPQPAREKEVTERLTSLLAERLEQHNVPESVREFVLNVWLRHLRTAILRDGEDSSEYKVALQVVDDLLWSLDTSRERQSRSELAHRIPPLIRLLTQGLRAIGARDEEFKSFFDELFLIHLRKMQRRQRIGDTRIEAAVAAPDADLDAGGGEDMGVTTRTRRSEAGSDTALAPEPPSADASAADLHEDAPAGPGIATPSAQDAGTGQRLLEVLASLDLSDLPVQPRVQAAQAEDALERLRRGDWLQLTDAHGRPAYAKVAWINARRTVVLMVRHSDHRALSMRTSELLERLRDGRAARIVAG